jgi:hypothetical protein
LLLIGLIVVSLIGICLRLWTDTALPLLADAVPMLVAIAGVVMSYKQPKRESHLMATVVLFAVGIVGTGVMSWTRIRTERAHRQEVKDLNGRVDVVRDQNTQILLRLSAGPKPGTKEAELARRRAIQEALRGEYILSHENISPGLLAGNELPPADWMNKRLRELGEKWTVTPPPLGPIDSTTPPKAHLDYGFYVLGQREAPREIDAPTVDGITTVKVVVVGTGTATLHNVSVWLRLGIGCEYAKEPSGVGAQPFVTGSEPTDREWKFPQVYPGVASPAMTADVKGPSRGMDFVIGVFYACDECGPVNWDEGRQHPLTVHVK